MRQGLFYALLVLCGAFFTGCATTDPQISFKPPQYVDELPAREIEDDFGNAGSLFGRGDNPLFADRRAMKVNDLVTIVINETATSSSSSDKSTSKTSETNLNGPTLGFTGPSQSIGRLAGKVNNLTGFGLSGGSDSSFEGSGSQTRSDRFTTTISARIIKVMENGNYFIEGGREILINGEKQIMRLTGVIRPYDIGRNNTINSQYIADARIMYDTQGELKKSTEKGWGTKTLEAIWPF